MGLDFPREVWLRQQLGLINTQMGPKRWEEQCDLRCQGVGRWPVSSFLSEQST